MYTENQCSTKMRRGYEEEEVGKGGVREAQLTEASEIFGTEYLEFMGGEGTGGVTATGVAGEGGGKGGREGIIEREVWG